MIMDNRRVNAIRRRREWRRKSQSLPKSRLLEREAFATEYPSSPDEPPPPPPPPPPIKLAESEREDDEDDNDDRRLRDEFDLLQRDLLSDEDETMDATPPAEPATSVYQLLDDPSWLEHPRVRFEDDVEEEEDREFPEIMSPNKK